MRSLALESARRARFQNAVQSPNGAFRESSSSARLSPQAHSEVGVSGDGDDRESVRILETCPFHSQNSIVTKSPSLETFSKSVIHKVSARATRVLCDRERDAGHVVVVVVVGRPLEPAGGGGSALEALAPAPCSFEREENTPRVRLKRPSASCGYTPVERNNARTHTL